MTTPIRLAALPSTSAVATAVTGLVCAWFVLAGGAMLAGQHSEHTIENARARSFQVSADHTPNGMVVTATRTSATL